MCQLSSVSKRTSEDGYNSGATHYQSILFFLACRARTENKKKGEDDTAICVFHPAAFPLPIFFTFWSRKGDISREAHNAKRNGLAKERCEIHVLQTELKWQQYIDSYSSIESLYLPYIRIFEFQPENSKTNM